MTKAIYLLYRSLGTLAFPLLLLYFVYRGVRQKAYWQSFGERLGFLPRSLRQTAAGAIWLHAVSVGEVLSSLELLRRLRAEFPAAPLFVSTTTLAGRALAAEKLERLADGIFYAPVDLVWVVRRVLRTLRPWLVIVAETEIWPNLFREVKRAGCGLLIVNGRISDRTAPRYRKLRWFFRHALAWPDAILAQTGALRRRYLQLGAPPARLSTAGNLKYDFEPKPQPTAFASLPAGARLWIAASTMPPAGPDDPDEDDVVIAAFSRLSARHPDLRLMLVPRRPERFDTAARKLDAAGIPYLRRSHAAAWDGSPKVLLLDTIGELSGLFGLADVVFMGGSLAARGGHNILEPAFFSKPVVVGPHMENFQAIADQFREERALLEIRDPTQLAGAVDSLLLDTAHAAELGRRALACAQANRGATARALQEIRRIYPLALPHFRPPLPAILALWPLSKLWTWGSRRRPRAVQRLKTPVVSVGNLSMGGTGKTPFVLWLARRMNAGILTRGYRRRSAETLALAPGACLPSTMTGDEPQIFLRSALAPTGIGADRFTAGRMLEQRFPVEVFVLDDGFQHRRLHRDVDIVLIDALDPTGDVFPLGRLREPPRALERATILVVTRSDRRMPGIERHLRCYNSRAPLFYARTVPECWVHAASGRRCPLNELPSRRAAAFCGLANPASFWRTLRTLGLRPEIQIAFPDHHQYRLSELPPGDILLTTQKDLANLPEIPNNLYWLKIGFEVEDEQALREAIAGQLRLATKSHS